MSSYTYPKHTVEMDFTPYVIPTLQAQTPISLPRYKVKHVNGFHAMAPKRREYLNVLEHKNGVTLRWLTHSGDRLYNFSQKIINGVVVQEKQEIYYDAFKEEAIDLYCASTSFIDECLEKHGLIISQGMFYYSNKTWFQSSKLACDELKDIGIICLA